MIIKTERVTHSDKGFTLIETIASIGLLAMLAVAIFPFFVQLAKGSVQSEDYFVAGHLLYEIADDLEAQGLPLSYEDLPPDYSIKLTDDDLSLDYDYPVAFQITYDEDVALYRTEILIYSKKYADSIVARTFVYIDLEGSESP